MWIYERDGSGRTSLHHALESEAPDAVARAILEVWPGAANEANNDGNTPLHFALGDLNAQEGVALAMIETCPAAAAKKNLAGDTPLYLALEHNAPEIVTLAVLGAWPVEPPSPPIP